MGRKKEMINFRSLISDLISRVGQVTWIPLPLHSIKSQKQDAYELIRS